MYIDDIIKNKIECCNGFIWYNLPKTIKAKEIEKMFSENKINWKLIKSLRKGGEINGS